MKTKRYEIDFEKNIIPEKDQITFKQELYRKSIHFASLSIPISYLYFDKEIVLLVCFCIMLALVIPDIARKFSKRLNNLILFFFKNMLRKKERENDSMFNGASWVMINAVLILIFFPEYIASISLAILIIGDAFAALFGRRFGKRRIYNKSLEGTLAFIASGFLVILYYYHNFSTSAEFLVAGIIAVIVGSIVELLAKKYRVDDNFAIPITVGTILWTASSFADKFGNGFAHLL